MSASDPRCVFLDATVFIGAGFNMESRDLRTLESLASSGTVHLITTDVVVREVRANIEKAIREAASAHATFSRKAAILRAASCSRHLVRQLDTAPIAKQVAAGFDAFLDSTHTTVLPTAELPAGPVLADYFKKAPPFHEGKKEFPDAFSLAAIRQHIQGTSAGSLTVVSADAGFAEAAKALPDVEVVTTLRALLDDIYSSGDEVLARFLKHELLKRRKQLTHRVKELFTDGGFDVAERWEAEVVEARVTTVHLPDGPDEVEIVELTEGKATLSVLVSVEFDADIRYGDESSASHNKEFGTTYWNHIEETVSETQHDIDLQVEVSFEKIDPQRFRVDDVSLYRPDTVFVETSYDREMRDDYLK